MIERRKCECPNERVGSATAPTSHLPNACPNEAIRLCYACLRAICGECLALAPTLLVDNTTRTMAYCLPCDIRRGS